MLLTNAELITIAASFISFYYFFFSFVSAPIFYYLIYWIFLCKWSLKVMTLNDHLLDISQNLESYCPMCMKYLLLLLPWNSERFFEMFTNVFSSLRGYFTIYIHTGMVRCPFLAVIGPKGFLSSVKTISTFKSFIIQTADHLGWKCLPLLIKMT